MTGTSRAFLYTDKKDRECQCKIESPYCKETSMHRNISIVKNEENMRVSLIARRIRQRSRLAKRLFKM